MEDYEDLKNKRIFIKTKTGRIYTGIVKIYENNIIKMIDKFGSLVYISEDEIAYLEVRR